SPPHNCCSGKDAFAQPCTAAHSRTGPHSPTPRDALVRSASDVSLSPSPTQRAAGVTTEQLCAWLTNRRPLALDVDSDCRRCQDSRSEKSDLILVTRRRGPPRRNDRNHDATS
ncbi:hypothetical protein Dimus_022867, partial [Dionaea muscipula]